MAADDRGFLTRALGAFHQGVRSGAGATETVQVGPRADRAGGPYFSILAAAGLGGLVLTASVMPDAARAGEADVRGGTLDRQAVSMARVDTKSPRLGIHAEDWRAFVRGRDMTVLDLLDDSETFGRGAPGSVVERFKLTWSLVRPVAMLVDKSKVPDPAAGGAGESGIACTIVLGGPSVAGTVAEKAATVGGVLERAESGVPIMAEDGMFATSPERIRVAMTDGSFDNFAAYHEMGHCADPDFRVEAIRDADGHGRAYLAHLHEAFADAFATIMIARAEGHTRTAEEMAHLRMLSTATGGSFHALAETWGGDRAAEVIDNPGARYHTAPTIDATVAWIRDVGIEWVRAMSPEAILAKAREMVEAVRLTPEAHARLKVDLLDTRMDGGRMLFGPGLGQNFAARAAEAMAALGFRPRAGDAPGLAGPETVLAADSGGASRGTASWGGLSPPARGGTLAQRGHVGTTDVDTELDADIREGAWIVATARRGKVVEVRMRESDGTVTRAIVGGKGEVMRYGPDGKLSSLSPGRPAITLADGTIRHRLVVDGEQIDVDADGVRRHFEERRQAAPGGRPSTLRAGDCRRKPTGECAPSLDVR